MSIHSDRKYRSSYHNNQYPLIDDRTGFRISSKDAIVDYGDIVTHKKNKKGIPQTLILPEIPTNELYIDGPVRPPKFYTYASRENYMFMGDVAFNDRSFLNSFGLNLAELNPDYVTLQQQLPTYWQTVDATWNSMLGKWTNKTYNQNIQFGPTTFVANWGDTIQPEFHQVQFEGA
jgi:hypothetical protein